MSFKLPILPQTAGAVTLVVELTAQAAGQFVQRRFPLHYNIQADLRAQFTNIYAGRDVVTGGVVNYVGEDIITGDGVNKAGGDQVNITRGQAAARPGQTEPPGEVQQPDRPEVASEPPGNHPCPNCQQIVPDQAFCIRCGFSLDKPQSANNP